MSTGCNSEFEGEIVWYEPACPRHRHQTSRADSILELINIPANVIKFILDADMELSSHMGIKSQGF
jgi:hypothetical protein